MCTHCCDKTRDILKTIGIPKLQQRLRATIKIFIISQGKSFFTCLSILLVVTDRCYQEECYKYIMIKLNKVQET